MKTTIAVCGAILLFAAVNAPASVLYVNLNSTNPTPPYGSWNTAATNIQAAVDAASAGDQILVTNGVYQTGGRVVYGSLTNRVVINKAVTIQSVNGSAVTTIRGNQPLGNKAVRCVYLTNNAILIGFTLTNGATINSSQGFTNNGAGAWCETGGVISNCVVTENFGGTGGGIYGGNVWNSLIFSNTALYGGGAASASLFNCEVISNLCPAAGGEGGGIYQGMISNCVVKGNQAYQGGAAIYQSTAYNSVISSNSSAAGYSVLNACIVTANLSGMSFCTNYNCIIAGNHGGMFAGVAYNCLVSSNTSFFGGGAEYSILYNCTVVGNSAMDNGGGVYSVTAFNSIIYGNSAPSGSNYFGSTLNYCDTTPLAPGLGDITNDPVFMNLSGGDYHLQTNSPCINSGDNAYVTTNIDFDGNARIVGGKVDIGAYEYQTPTSILSYAWAQQYGLPTDGSADFIDSDGDGLNNWQEWKAGTIPTNAASVLELASPSNSVSGVTVTWQSVTNVTYYLQSSTNLASQPAFSSIQSNIVGQIGSTSYTDTTATNGGPYFYRVGVQ